MSDLVLIAREGAIATVLLNRPERLNALTLAMWERLGAVMADLNADDSVRCVVLRGAGNEAFGAGADISEFNSLRANSAQAREYARRIEPALKGVEDCPHPTLAVINGPCVGGGLEIAILCDVRLCARSARFGIPINRIGHTLPYSGMRALVELIGRSNALSILLEGRVFRADEALAMGLVTRVVADDALEDEGYVAAARIADGAPLAARWHKKFARRVLDPAPLSEAEADESFLSCDTEDYREGVRAFLAKEKPRFKGR